VSILPTLTCAKGHELVVQTSEPGDDTPPCGLEQLQIPDPGITPGRAPPPPARQFRGKMY
jgi:hypothetical protein